VTDPSTHDVTRLKVRGITTTFGEVVANAGVDLTLEAGSILGLIGENGAGKSTLIKAITGLQRPDAGTVTVDGVTLPVGSPRAALDAGVGMLHQEPMVLRRMTVFENLVAGRHGHARADRAWAAQVLQEHGRSHGFDLDLDTRVESLTIGEHQQLEIIRLLAGGVRVLILDEPTSAISESQRALLFTALRELVAAGLSVILVSHKLDEVLDICDRFTVLRHGRVTGHRVAPVEPDDLVSLMFGDTPAPTQHAPGSTATDELRLDVRGLVAREGAVVTAPLTLTAMAGAVIGLAGLEGSGQRALLRGVAGFEPLRSGTVQLDGTDVTRDGAHARPSRGMHYVPADRAIDGLVPGLSVTDHILLGGHTGRLVHREGARANAAAVVQRARVVGTPASTPDELSGGNQQRLMLGLLPDDARLLLLEHPTRGLDLQSAAWVWQQLRARAAGGATVIFASSDIDELLAADQIIVFFDGDVLARMTAAETDSEQLGHLISGRVRS
jgi:ABC-type uncharacterized transport system ATPase subunit